MKLARDLLLSMLEAASPALGTTRNLVPGLSHFWFDSDGVTAFNDVLGIRVAFDNEILGGVEGERLLGLVKNSTAKNVTIVTKIGVQTPFLHIELGSTGVKLPRRPVTEALFHEKFPEKRAVTVTAEFVNALKLVMLSCVSKKLASSVERGVTVVQTGDGVDMYTTDNVTVSTARVEDCLLFPTADPDRAIWPREFCDYFVKHFSDGARVAMTDDAVFCTADSGGLTVTVYAKLVEDSTPVDFARFVDRHQDKVAVAFKVPDDLTRALSRAAAMVPEKSPVVLEVTTIPDPDTRVLRLYVNSSVGEFDDLIEIDASGHDDLRVKADVALIRRALAGRTALTLTPGSVVLVGPPGFLHFISTMR